MNPRTPTRHAGLLLSLAAGALALGACSAGPASSQADAPSTNAVPVTVGTAPPVGGVDTTAAPVTTAPAPVAASRNVQVLHDGVAVRSAADDSAATVTTLGAKTKLGSKTTLLALGEQDGWVQVALPTRPNGATGWVRSTDVKERDNSYEVRIELGAHRLTVTKDGEVAVTADVAVGAPGTPTPTGRFYITDLLENDDPSGAYGPFALGLSAHSDTLTEFAGGDGQIGIHGTNDPSSIGRSVSHGCVRLPNELIAGLARTLPLGTPVTIV